MLQARELQHPHRRFMLINPVCVKKWIYEKLLASPSSHPFLFIENCFISSA
jgi:hypothetical protein